MRALRNLPRLACCVVGILALADCGVARAQAPDREFQHFFATFTEALRLDGVARIADSIHFPFFVYGSRHSRSEFLNDKNETVNLFTRPVRNQIVKSTPDDFVTYRNKQEIGENKPDFALIPDGSPVVELDLINERGGPARRLMFAKSGAGYQLFCVVQ